VEVGKTVTTRDHPQPVRIGGEIDMIGISNVVMNKEGGVNISRDILLATTPAAAEIAVDKNKNVVMQNKTAFDPITSHRFQVARDSDSSIRKNS
jgi:hypothetical protein